MGMFDRVYAQCKCGARVEFQSKAGDCSLNTYNADDVPSAIALDLSGKSEQCESCRRYITLRFPRTAPRFVSMDVESQESF